MRNRGVEIYLLDNATDYDVKSILHLSGLRNPDCIGALQEMHKFVSDLKLGKLRLIAKLSVDNLVLVLGEKPDVTELQHCAFLISQQLARGISIYASFFNSITDVYYNTKSDCEFDTYDFVTVIKEKLAKVLVDHQIQFNADLTLNVTNTSTNSNLERIKQDSALFRSSTHETYLLIHFYSIASPADFRLRNLFMETFLQFRKNPQLLEIKEKFESVLSAFSAKNLVFDSKWIGLSENHFNRIFILLYYLAKQVRVSLLKPEAKRSKKEKFTHLHTILSNLRGKSYELENNVLDYLDDFDNLLRSVLQSEIVLDDNQVGQILSLIKWRFILQQLTYVTVKDVNGIEFNDVLNQLHIHYRWFWKNCIRRLGNHFRLESETFMVPVENLSPIHRLAKPFQKCNAKPLPSTDSIYLEASTKLKNMCDKCNLHSINANQTKIALMNTKISLDKGEALNGKIEEIDEMTASAERCTEYQAALIPILNVFSRYEILKLRGGFDNNFSLLERDVATSPLLLASLHRRLKTSDKRLLHQIHSDLLYHLINSPATLPMKFLRNNDMSESVEEVRQPIQAPTIAYLFTQILVSKTGVDGIVAAPNLGNYREMKTQSDLLKLLLWRNMRQISDVRYQLM